MITKRKSPKAIFKVRTPQVLRLGSKYIPDNHNTSIGKIIAIGAIDNGKRQYYIELNP
jgi:hypothetical protein